MAYYTWDSSWSRTDGLGLKPIDTLVLSVIHSLTKSTYGKCKGLNYIASEIGVKRQTVKESVDRLIELNIVHAVQNGRGKQTSFYSTYEKRTSANGLVQKTDTTSTKNVPPSSTKSVHEVVRKTDISSTKNVPNVYKYNKDTKENNKENDITSISNKLTIQTEEKQIDYLFDCEPFSKFFIPDDLEDYKKPFWWHWYFIIPNANQFTKALSQLFDAAYEKTHRNIPYQFADLIYMGLSSEHETDPTMSKVIRLLQQSIQTVDCKELDIYTKINFSQLFEP